MAIYKSKFTGKQIDALLDKVDGKQDKLTAGKGISITGNTIAVNLDLSIYKIVTDLPTKDIELNKIYLKASATQGSENKYAEYIYADNAWEKLGEFTTNVNLADYATKSEVNTLGDSIDSIGESVNTLSDTASSHSAKITNLENNMNSLISDADYEVVLFKKSS